MYLFFVFFFFFFFPFFLAPVSFAVAIVGASLALGFWLHNLNIFFVLLIIDHSCHTLSSSPYFLSNILVLL